MKGKTSLKRKEKKTNEPTKEYDINSSKMIKGKTSLTKKKNPVIEEKALQETNIAENLIEQIVLTYFTSRWQKKVLAMKNRVNSRPNKKSKDVRTLVRVIDRAFNYHTYLYLIELFDNMKSMPVPNGVEHDPNYLKVFLVKSEGKKGNYEEIAINDIVINDNTYLRSKDVHEKPGKNIINKDEKSSEFPELNVYYYRNDGKPLDRVEIEKDINRMIEENPEKDIDVERILNSKRLQYKLKHPRFNPFTKKENIENFVRYLYTYKPEKNKDNKENIIVIKNRTYAYY